VQLHEAVENRHLCEVTFVSLSAYFIESFKVI
jgi:hypothetical protein